MDKKFYIVTPVDGEGRFVYGTTTDYEDFNTLTHSPNPSAPATDYEVEQAVDDVPETVSTEKGVCEWLDDDLTPLTPSVA